MNKSLTNLLDKALTKGMKLLESERAQKLLSSPQAQSAMDFGLKALGNLQETSESIKSFIVQKLGVATKDEVQTLRDELARANEQLANSKSKK